MNKNDSKNGIAAYQREQAVLLRLIKMTGGLTESKFDSLFRGREYRRPMKLRPMLGDSFILGIGSNGFSEWAWQLDLLQHMIVVGIVDAVITNDGEIAYVIPAQGQRRDAA